MSNHLNDTICAIATATGGAARGVVRISGPNAVAITANVFECTAGTSLEAVQLPTAVTGRATVQLHGDRTHTLPCDAFLWPTARSYTREPVVELHTLGSPPLLESLLAAVCRAGARLADPGEFTLRAFLAGRIDLTQAEAVLGVIDARNQDDLTAALTQLAGGLARPLHQLREGLLQLLAELEAGLDFVEEDIEFITKESLFSRLSSASRLLAEVAQQMSSRATAAVTTQVALVGPPNAGKSSLFNAVVTRYGSVGQSTTGTPSQAIVSPQRGTTRDYLTAIIEIDGIFCEIVDTAGVDPTCLPSPLVEGWGEGSACDETFRPALGHVETLVDAVAQTFAAERRAAATIRVHCLDATDVTPSPADAPQTPRGFVGYDIVALTKCDLLPAAHRTSATLPNDAAIGTSSRTGLGLDELCGRIRGLLASEAASQHGLVVAATSERCRESIRLAESAVSRASEIIRGESGDELAAAEIRIALAELGKVIGAVYTDDLLDRIFSSFCIGK